MASDICASSAAAVEPALSQSEMSGSGVLIVVGEPVNQLDKDAVLKKITDGFSSWDSDQTGCDINAELSEIASAAPTGVAGVNGEHTIHGESTNLHVDVLINPLIETVTDALRVLLLLPTKHKHIIYAGYSFERTGNWILQDGAFTFADLTAVSSQPDVAAALQERATGGGFTLALHCHAEGHWQEAHVRASVIGQRLNASVNPAPAAASPAQQQEAAGVVQFAAYLSLFVRPFVAAEALQTSTILGSLNFERPTVYAFPAGRGDCALFGISGFNMLVDGGAARQSCFWPCVRHINCLDVLVVSHVGENNALGLKSFLQKKAAEPSARPAIGHVYFNGKPTAAADASAAASSGSKELTVDLAHEAGQLTSYLHAAGCSTSLCHSAAASKDAPIAPVNLYHKIGHGSLDMYVLNPSKESAGKATAAVDGTSSVAILLVWKPVSPGEKATRILFPGSTPQAELLKAFEKLKHLDALRVERPKTASTAVATPSKAGAAAAKKQPPSKLNAAGVATAAAAPRSSTPTSSSATPAAEAVPASPAATGAATPPTPAATPAVEEEQVVTASAAQQQQTQRSASPSSRSITKSPSPSPPKSPQADDAVASAGPGLSTAAAADEPEETQPPPEEEAQGEVDEDADAPAVAWQDDDETKPEALPEPLCAAGSLPMGSYDAYAGHPCEPAGDTDGSTLVCPTVDADDDTVPDEPLGDGENVAGAVHDSECGDGNDSAAAIGGDQAAASEDALQEPSTEGDAGDCHEDVEPPADTEIAADEVDPSSVLDEVNEEKEDSGLVSLQGEQGDESGEEERAASPGLAGETDLHSAPDESQLAEEPVEAVTSAEGLESEPPAVTGEDGSEQPAAEGSCNDEGQADGYSAEDIPTGDDGTIDAAESHDADEDSEMTPTHGDEFGNVAAGSADEAQPDAPSEAVEDVKADDEGETAAEYGKADDEVEVNTDDNDITDNDIKADDEGEMATVDVKADDEGEMATEDVIVDDEGEMATKDIEADEQDEMVTEGVKPDEQGEVSVFNGDDSPAGHEADNALESQNDEIAQDEGSAGSNSSTPKPCGTPVDQPAPGLLMTDQSAATHVELPTEDEEPGEVARDSVSPLVADEAPAFYEPEDAGHEVPGEDVPESAALDDLVTAQLEPAVESEPAFESETAGDSGRTHAAEELPEDSSALGNPLLDFGIDAGVSNMQCEASSCSASDRSSVRASYCDEDADEISMVAVSGSSAHIADVMSEVGFTENDGDAKPSRYSASAGGSIEDIPAEGAGLAAASDSHADMFDPLAEWGAPQHLPSPPSPTPQQSEAVVADDAPAAGHSTNGAGDGAKPQPAAGTKATKPQKADGAGGHKEARNKTAPTKKQPTAKQVNGVDGASKAGGDAAAKDKAKGAAPAAKPTTASAPASAKSRPASSSAKAGSPAGAATATKPKSAPPTSRAPKSAPAPNSARSAGEPEAASSSKGPAADSGSSGKKPSTKAAAPAARPSTAPPARAAKAGSQEPPKGAAPSAAPKNAGATEPVKADAGGAAKKPKPAAAAAAPAPSAAAAKAAAPAPPAKPAATASAPKTASATLGKHASAGVASASAAKGGHAAAAAATAVVPFCVDLAYLPHHVGKGAGAADFFRHVRSRYYVLSGVHTPAAPDILDGLLAAKDQWSDGGRSTAVTVIPVHDSDALLHWQALNRDRAAALNVDVAPAASRAIIHLQDDEGAFHAYRQEF